MGAICSFGEPTCGFEDVGAFVAFAAALVGLIGLFFVARYQKPVMDAQGARLTEAERRATALERQNETQAQQIKNLQELVTHAAQVETFRSDSAGWRADSQKEHEAMLETQVKIATNLAQMNRMLAAMAKSMGVQVRSDDLGD